MSPYFFMAFSIMDFLHPTYRKVMFFYIFKESTHKTGENFHYKTPNRVISKLSKGLTPISLLHHMVKWDKFITNSQSYNKFLQLQHILQHIKLQKEE